MAKRSRTSLFLLLGALTLTGCFMVGMPGRATNFLSGGDETIARIVRESAADWAAHGLEIANYVTVDDGRGGVPVRFAPAREIEQYRPPDAPPVLLALSVWEMGDWLHVLIDDRLKGNDAEVSRAIKHELIHVLVPNAPHIDHGIALLTPVRTSDVITRADMAHLARYTKVNPSEVPFAGEETV